MNVKPVLENEEEIETAEEENKGCIEEFLNKNVMAATIEGLLGEISGVEHPIEELQLLKTALLSIPVNALRDAVSGRRFNVIFALLSSDSRSVFISHLLTVLASERVNIAESVVGWCSLQANASPKSPVSVEIQHTWDC